MSNSSELRRALRGAGFASSAIDAVWPEWWTKEAESSLSARSELRFTVARRLGLSPQQLLADEPAFIWRDEAKFKNLGAATEQERAILTSFGVAVGRATVRAFQRTSAVPSVSALELREAILRSAPTVTLDDLLPLCWGLGIPVVYLTVFPLGNKRMHAMTVRSDDSYAILLGRASKFAAQIAYLVAHEVGHIMLEHVANGVALLEIEDPLRQRTWDEEEDAADRYALALLTGTEHPDIASSQADFSASQLARAAAEAAADRQVDPGILALCFGHSSGHWREVFGALKILPPGETDVVTAVNAVARHQMDWDGLPPATREYLDRMLGSGGAG